MVLHWISPEGDSTRFRILRAEPDIPEWNPERRTPVAPNKEAFATLFGRVSEQKPHGAVGHHLAYVLFVVGGVTLSLYAQLLTGFGIAPDNSCDVFQVLNDACKRC